MTSPAGTPDQWSGIAAWYDDLLSGGSGPHQHATAVTLRLAGNVGGAVVLDLACGQGTAARALASAGAASVTGVDASPEMIALAEGYEASRPLGIRTLPTTPKRWRRLRTDLSTWSRASWASWISLTWPLSWRQWRGFSGTAARSSS
jgi:SAM-dependent methyltransferase